MIALMAGVCAACYVWSWIAPTAFHYLTVGEWSVNVGVQRGILRATARSNRIHRYSVRATDVDWEPGEPPYVLHDTPLFRQPRTLQICGVAVSVWHHLSTPLLVKPSMPKDASTVPVYRRIILTVQFSSLLFYLITYLSFLALYRGLRKRRRSKRNECLSCGYSLVGNQCGVCTECGSTIRTPRARSARG